MDDLNLSVLIGLAISLVVFGIYVYLTYKQSYEIAFYLKRDDGLNGLRRIILLLLLVSLATAVPSALYLGSRLAGIDSEDLRNLVTVTGRISQLSQAILIMLIFRYQRKLPK